MLHRILFIWLLLLSNHIFSDQWDLYYKNTQNMDIPRKTVEIVSKYFEIENKIESCAADLGAGTGRDALFLLSKGWSVLAVDAESEAIAILQKRVPEKDAQRLSVQISPFNTMHLPYNLDLINASYSLPFCHPKDFEQCWQTIVDHIAIGGRFSGQFFGNQDKWAEKSEMTHFTHEQLLKLFQDRFEIEYLQIETGKIPKADGKIKISHVFHVIAKKIK